MIAHHPIVFGGLKRITGRNYVERVAIKAIKNDIAVYAAHTNLDNVRAGVSAMMAKQLGLENTKVLDPKSGLLRKLYTFVPSGHASAVQEALFAAGAGHIGNYSECSFIHEGTGTFKGGGGTDPFAGKPGERHGEAEVKVEVIFPAQLEGKVTAALLKAHPYEEVAFDVVKLENRWNEVGSGLIGELPEGMEEMAFLAMVKERFRTGCVRYTPLRGKKSGKLRCAEGRGASC